MQRSRSNILANKVDLNEKTEHSTFFATDENPQQLQEDEIQGVTQISKPLI